MSLKDPQVILRMPRARQLPPDVEHQGIIIEKSGEDNNESKKNRVMYLYSRTVRKHCGKLVCSVDWRDYELGDWICFTQQENETYFGSYSIKPPYPTRISPTNGILVQIQVHFFVVPNYISNRRTHHLGEPLQKMWSPELGGAYSDLKSIHSFKIADGVLYKGWLQYSPHTVNFDVHNQDPEGWPYEPMVFWQLLHEKGVNDKLYEFEQMAKEETEIEKKKKREDFRLFEILADEAGKSQATSGFGMRRVDREDQKDYPVPDRMPFFDNNLSKRRFGGL